MCGRKRMQFSRTIENGPALAAYFCQQSRVELLMNEFSRAGHGRVIGGSRRCSREVLVMTTTKPKRKQQGSTLAKPGAPKTKSAPPDRDPRKQHSGGHGREDREDHRLGP